MWLLSNRSNLFGGPWQSWSVSNLCFRQKFLRQVLQVTGTSWRRKTTELILEEERVMSKFANKGLVVPLIFLCSLIQILTLTPPPNNALLANMGHVSWILAQNLS